MTGPAPMHQRRNGVLMFPRKSGHRIYAMGLPDGGVKVGQSAHPRRRAAEIARKWGGSMRWVHLFAQSFPRHMDAAVVERVAAALLSAVGSQRGATEVFDGLTREDAIQCVREAIRRATPETAKE